LSHPFFSTRRLQVFAHRGGGALAPENTFAAFDNGLAKGAQGLELDVRLSADGVVVVHHDRTLERTTNLTGPIANRTAGELARADAGYFFRRVQEDASSTRDAGLITRSWGSPSGGPFQDAFGFVGSAFRRTNPAKAGSHRFCRSRLGPGGVSVSWLRH